MGTRSNTIIVDTGVILVNIYRQFDGYPEGHGLELANFLRGLKLVNGINETTKGIANGMGCLAAQLVAQLKAGPGGIYIHRQDDGGNDYTYTLSGNTFEPEKGVSIEVKEGDDVVFTGNPLEFLGFCETVTEGA